jgi:hypothetical protein
MGKHADKFLKDRAGHLQLCLYANAAVVVACLADYLFFGHPYALETLAVLVILINGFAIWQQRNGLNQARTRDLEDQIEEARAEAARDAHLKSRGLR